MEYPWGALGVFLPTAALVAPGAAVAVCAWLKPSPSGLDNLSQEAKVSAVFVGDSLTQGTLSSNYVELIAQQNPGTFVNAGLNMRTSGDALQGTLLERAASAAPESGVAVLLGTNDLIRYTALPRFLRPPVRRWLQGYFARLRDIQERLLGAGVTKVTLASPPILGEDLRSEEARLGRLMARVVRRAAASLGPRCSYAPLFEATAGYLERQAAAGAGAGPGGGGRAYSLGSSLLLLGALPWRMYGTRTPLHALQEEEGLDLTVDLVHFGPRFADIAARTFAESMGLRAA